MPSDYKRVLITAALAAAAFNATAFHRDAGASHAGVSIASAAVAAPAAVPADAPRRIRIERCAADGDASRLKLVPVLSI